MRYFLIQNGSFDETSKYLSKIQSHRCFWGQISENPFCGTSWSKKDPWYKVSPQNLRSNLKSTTCFKKVYRDFSWVSKSNELQTGSFRSLTLGWSGHAIDDVIGQSSRHILYSTLGSGSTRCQRNLLHHGFCIHCDLIFYHMQTRFGLSDDAL